MTLATPMHAHTAAHERPYARASTTHSTSRTRITPIPASHPSQIRVRATRSETPALDKPVVHAPLGSGAGEGLRGHGRDDVSGCQRCHGENGQLTIEGDLYFEAGSKVLEAVCSAGYLKSAPKAPWAGSRLSLQQPGPGEVPFSPGWRRAPSCQCGCESSADFRVVRGRHWGHGKRPRHAALGTRKRASRRGRPGDQPP
jgi:hypothetical protein